MSVDIEAVKSRKRTVSKVSMPEWDGHVYVRELSAASMLSLRELSEPSNNGKANAVDVLVGWVIAGTADDNGKCIFADEDSEWLRDEPYALLDRLVYAIWTFNGLNDAATKSRKKN
jgi:hypothetical protein